MEFSKARALIEQKGWTIVPDIEDPINVFDFQGSRYELRWRDGHVVSILQDDNEISWEQLPEALKGLL
jgi:hypothetical protein